MNGPKASLLVTARGAAAFLREAVESALAQEGAPAFEIVLVDDGSTDKTWEIMEEFRASASPRGPEVKTRRLSPGLGRAGALIEARRLAEGEFLGWLDADDVLEPAALRRCCEKLDEDPALGFVATRCWNMSADGRKLWPWKPGDCELTMRQLEKAHVAHHFRLARASVYDEAGGPDPEFVAGVDYDLCLRMAELAPMARIPSRLYRWRRRPGSMSSALRREQAAFMELARARRRERLARKTSGEDSA